VNERNIQLVDDAPEQNYCVQLYGYVGRLVQCKA